MDTTCEGFTNYETFAVAVVTDNDRSPHDHIRWFVLELDATDREEWEKVEAVRDYYEAQMPELDGFWSSLLRAGWEGVNWSELTEHWRDPEWRAVNA